MRGRLFLIKNSPQQVNIRVIVNHDKCGLLLCALCGLDYECENKTSFVMAVQSLVFGGDSN